MASDDNDELNEILEYGNTNDIAGDDPYFDAPYPEGNITAKKKAHNNIIRTLTQWSTSDNKIYVPSSETVAKLSSGVYEIKESQTVGLYFQKIDVKTEGLVRFPQTNTDVVLKEIQTFWEKEAIFKEYGITHKRGIILWGSPGGGKSSCVQLIMKDVIDRGGIVVKFTYPELFLEGMRIIREIEKETPIVVIMEDIDSIIENFNESSVLNLLDGVDNLNKIVFLATTNYPDRLGARIINRPSRFDKRFKISNPNLESRKIYLNHLIGEHKIRQNNIDIDKWAEDTDGFSIAHLKELFVAVIILGDDYDDAIRTLSSMKEAFRPKDYEDKPNRGMGFANKEVGSGH